jgi:hypothetical protein
MEETNEKVTIDFGYLQEPAINHGIDWFGTA